MDLSRKPEVAGLILEEVGEVQCRAARRGAGATHPAAQQGARGRRRRDDAYPQGAPPLVAEKYAPVIEAFYGGKSDVEVTMEITFEDGRRSTLRNTIAIHDVPAAGAGKRAA